MFNKEIMHNVFMSKCKGHNQLQRYAVGCQYHGRHFHGWQRQSQLPTIAGQLDVALGRVANHPIFVQGSGRTDRGVHAHQQVFHFDSDAKRTLEQWLLGAHTHLPDAIRCQWIEPVSIDFHARFSAQSRRYCYLIYCAPVASVWWQPHAWWCPYTLDFERMQHAADQMVGEHDFSGLRGGDCQAKSPVKTIHAIDVHVEGAMCAVVVHGVSFLHHMVRNMVGLLMQVGRGKHHLDWVHAVLNAKQRHPDVPMAPAHGLYFVEACYDPGFQIPAPSSHGFLPAFLFQNPQRQ